MTATALDSSAPPSTVHAFGRMDDAQIHDWIEELVAEEHELWDARPAGMRPRPTGGGSRSVKVALDRCWDLLRQRRALEEFGMDPDVGGEPLGGDRRALRAVAAGSGQALAVRSSGLTSTTGVPSIASSGRTQHARGRRPRATSHYDGGRSGSAGRVSGC